MKKLFLILILLLATKLFGQTEEIYRLTFSDQSNFRLTTLLNHKLPKTIFIIDTTNAWNSNRFWLTDFDNKDKERVIKSIQNDEHHPYFHSYLFSDTVLNMLVPDKEKQKLCKKSKTLKSKPVHLNGSNYKTITSSKNIKGFYFVTSEPIYSDDRKLAFIDLTVFYKETNTQSLNESYFGTIGIVYQRQETSWKRIAKKDWLIL